jgi:hypothetical protein
MVGERIGASKRIFPGSPCLSQTFSFKIIVESSYPHNVISWIVDIVITLAQALLFY